MGLRSPQDMPKVELRPEASSRLQAGGAPQISREFVGTLEQAATDRERMRVKRQALAKDSFDNIADAERVKYTAIVANEEGLNALSATTKQREVFKKSIEAQLSKLSPEYQDYLRPSIDEHLSKYDQTTIPHMYKESKKVEDTIKKERIVNNKNDAILMSADLDAFDSVGLENVYKKAKEYAQLKYGQDLEADVPGMPGVKVKEIIETTGQSAVSNTILGAIEEQAKANLPLARQLGERFTNELLPQDRLKAIKAIEKAQNDADNDIALNIANDAEKISPDDIAGQEKYIRANAGSTKLYKQSLEISRLRKTINDKVKKEQEDKVRADVNEKIMEGSFTPDMVKDLPPDKQSEVLKFATNWNQKKFIKTDDKTFKELDDMILDNPRQYAETNLMVYRDRLNDREFRSLKMAQDRIRSEGRGEQRRISANPDRITAGIRREFIERKGLYGQESEIYKISREFIEEELERNPKVTPMELRKKFAAVLYERGTKTEKNPGYNWFSPIKNKLPFTGITPEEIETISPTLIAPEEKPAIHPDNIMLVKNRRPDWSESQVLEYINRKIIEGVDLSIPIK